MKIKNIPKLLFIYTGTKLFMDYILITNPISKNPLVKYIYGFMKKAYTATDYKERLIDAKILTVIHLLGIGIYILLDVNWIANIIFNVYPILVQLYIGYRCYKIIKFKECQRRNQIELTSINTIHQ
jgi:hypothetical protein